MHRPPDSPGHQSAPEPDDISYQEITAMLGSFDRPDSQSDEEPEAKFAEAQSRNPMLPSASTPHIASTHTLLKTSSQDDDGTHEPEDKQARDVSGLPGVPVSVQAAATSTVGAVAPAETEESLFARLAALKAQMQVPAEDLTALTERLAALKGPAVSAAELADLHSRLETLKGSRDPVSLSELEGRLAKLKGSSPAPMGHLDQLKGRPEGELIPDFDPDVEMNQEQLEALASMGDNTTDNDFFEECLTGTTVQGQDPKQQQHCVSGTTNPKGNKHMDLRQAMQNFDPEEEDCLNEQQLQALASTPTKGNAKLPQWAAALGLTAQDLQRHDSDAEESSQHSCHSSVGNVSDSSNNSSEALEQDGGGKGHSAKSAVRHAARFDCRLKKLNTCGKGRQ